MTHLGSGVCIAAIETMLICAGGAAIAPAATRQPAEEPARDAAERSPPARPLPPTDRENGDDASYAAAATFATVTANTAARSASIRR
jgi:hypothetical protein